MNVMQEVRYPAGPHEWARMREVLMSARDGFGAGDIRLLEDDIDVDHIMVAVKEAAQKARDFKTVYDDKLKERTDQPGGKQDENRTGLTVVEHAGVQSVVPRNVELHVDSKTFVTTTATLLASPEGCWFRHMISSFPSAQEFYIDRSPVRTVVLYSMNLTSCRCVESHSCSPLPLTPAAHPCRSPLPLTRPYSSGCSSICGSSGT